MGRKRMLEIIPQKKIDKTYQQVKKVYKEKTGLNEAIKEVEEKEKAIEQRKQAIEELNQKMIASNPEFDVDSWMYDIISDNEYEEQMKDVIPLDSSFMYPDGYKREYDTVVKDIMSGELSSDSHACKTLKIGKGLLKTWLSRHKTFRYNYLLGKTIGEVKLRDKMRQYAFEPTAKVNLGLIKILAHNVYGITDEVAPSVVINNSNNQQNNSVREESAILFQKAIEEIEQEQNRKS